MSGPILCRASKCRPAEFGGARQAAPGRPLCDTCSERFGSDLAAMAKAWPDLVDRLAFEGRAGERISGTKLPGLVINEGVSAIMREVTDWAWWLARTALDGHKQATPPASSDMRVVLAWLARWHAWRLAYSADHELAVAVVDDADRYRSKVRRAAYPSTMRTVELPDAPCRVVGDNGQCPGRLFAVVRDSGASEIICDRDEAHRVPVTEWIAYARKINGGSQVGP
jgi:hypothetical protein